jgi:hypothetical protein
MSERGDAGVEVPCPGCIAYYQCGTVGTMPLRTIGPHLRQVHGWTPEEVEAFVFYGRAPWNCHRRWPLHSRDNPTDPRPIRPCDRCMRQVDFDGSCPWCRALRERVRARDAAGKDGAKGGGEGDA